MNTADVNPLTLPSLALEERSLLPSCPAIYFVLEGNSVLYIGRTGNLYQRWTIHHRWDQLQAINGHIRLAWLECDDTGLLPELERVLIQHFQPPLNGSALITATNRNRLTVDLKGLRERIETVRSDTAWKELSLGQKVRVLIQERLEQMENPGSFDKNLSSSANADVLSEK